MPIGTLPVRTTRRDELVEITADVAAEVRRQADNTKSGNGLCVVYVPHTTAGVCVQENADPDVQHDVLRKLSDLVPKLENYYRHAEGNSDSHLKAILTGTSITLLVDDQQLVLGTWQGLYLAEFDGPRQRKVHVKFVPDPP